MESNRLLRAKVHAVEIVEAYLSGNACHVVAKKFGVNSSTVTRLVREAGHEVRSIGNKFGSVYPTGSDSHAWKGGRVRRGDGYIEIQMYDGDPFYEMGNLRWRNGKAHPSSCHISEHRYVMAQKLGRPLLRSEEVHHINGQRDDNRPENLELWSRSQPPGQRIEDKIKWAKELLALYEPSALAESNSR